MFTFNIVPVVTEKSTLDSQNGKYHFVVPSSANKIEVKKQLEKMYGEKVDSVNIIKVKPKTRIVGRGKEITKRKPRKKVIVTFEKGKTIDINAIK